MTRSMDLNMSDSEDLDILDEIRALDDVLSPTKNTSRTTSNQEPEKKTHVVNEVEKDEENVARCITVQDTVHDDKFEAYRAAFDCNKELINCLQIAKEDVTSILKECEEKLQLIEKRLQEHSKRGMKGTKAILCTAGMPYFKDKDYFPAPLNEDAKLKASRGELVATSIGQLCRWTPKDRKILLTAIRQECIAHVLKGGETECESPNVSVSSMGRGSNTFLPRDFRDIVRSLKGKKFDWLKIAAADFDRRHSAEECRVMWHVYLHPDINKGKWTKQEVLKLNSIANKYKYQNWDQIAIDLKTNRSGYQCFIKYNSSKDSLLGNEVWTLAEDKRLLSLIQRFAVGDFIPWGEIAKYQGTRTKQQVYARWTYCLAPHLKKGRFTKEEDDMLLRAVGKYGKNFKKISSTVMPHRTSAQLADHYRTLVSRENKSGQWDIEDDMKLIKLYEEFGTQWTKIAEHFPNRNRTQLRHRYSALQRRGFFLEYRTDETLKDTDLVDNIDKQLVEYFRYVPYSTPGRKQKLYNPEELERETKKLYNVLCTLNASLNIPNDMSNLQLSQKDKQLLYSLKKYYYELRKQKENNEDLIEQVRMKMFGPSSTAEESQRCIQSTCVIAKAKNKRTRSVNSKKNDDNNHTIELQMEFDTPDSIIHFIGGAQKEIEFEKISLLLQGGNCTQVNLQEQEQNNQSLQSGPSNINSIAEIPGSVSDTNIVNVDLFNENERCPTGMDYKYPENLLQSLSCSESTAVLQFVGYGKFISTENSMLQSSTILPTDSTVTGFQNLNYWMEQRVAKNSYQETKIDIYHNETKRSIEALETLQERLTRLFKYPMGMTQILVPEIYEDDNAFIFDLQENRNNFKRSKQNAGNITIKKLKLDTSSKKKDPCVARNGK